MTNNKQQTAVKLYTEEQVLEIIANINRDVNVSSQELLEGIEVDQVQLPSDEEVGNEASVRHYGTNFKHVFASGAKWMRNKIQGGEQ
jgi:hypothetical protein